MKKKGGSTYLASETTIIVVKVGLQMIDFVSITKMMSTYSRYSAYQYAWAPK
jgi:hypothetical protein